MRVHLVMHLRSRLVLALGFSLMLLQLGACQSQGSKSSPKAPPSGVNEQGENIPNCTLPFTVEKLKSFEVVEGYYKVNGLILQAPWGLTTCRHETNINGNINVVTSKGYHQLYVFNPYTLNGKIRIEESIQGFDLVVPVASQEPTETHLKLVAAQLGAPPELNLKDAFVLQHYRMTTALVGEMPVAYANTIANSDFGYDVRIRFSNVKRSSVEKEIEQVGIKLNLIGGLSEYGTSQNYWSVNFAQLKEGQAGQLDLVNKVPYAQEIWRRAELSEFQDDIVSGMMMVYSLTRDLDSSVIKDNFKNLYYYCLDLWTKWPTVAQVEADEDNLYSNALSLLLRMEPLHNAKVVDDRMRQLSQVYNYSRGNMLALSLATIVDHKMTDGQFALAIKLAPTLNQQNMPPSKKWNLLVDLGNQFEWQETKMTNVVQLTSQCMNLARIGFEEAFGVARQYADTLMTGDQQKVLSDAYYFLQNTYSGPGFEKIQALSEALRFVMVDLLTATKLELMRETFSWMTNSYQVGLGKEAAFSEVKKWLALPTFERKNFDFLRDIFSKITNSYKQGYSKIEGYKKAELWVLNLELSRDQFTLLQDSFDFLANSYLAGLSKVEARDKAENWVVVLKLKNPQLVKIRDLFSQYSRKASKAAALAQAEKEVLGIN